MIADPVTTADAVSAVVRADGNLNLAAERLRLPLDELLGTITAHPEGFRMLSDQLRTLQLVKSFHLLKITEERLIEAITDTDKPEDVIKAYGQVATLFGNLTSQANKEPSITNNIDISAIMLNAMPAPIREAFLTLVQPDSETHAGGPAARPVLEEGREIIELPIGLARRRAVEDSD